MVRRDVYEKLQLPQPREDDDVIEPAAQPASLPGMPAPVPFMLTPIPQPDNGGKPFETPIQTEVDR